MKIAIVGSGVSGLLSARLLCGDHEVTVFEANGYAGGHTPTVTLQVAGRDFAADTGFMVFNDRTYPAFVRMLERLGVPARASDMSFSVRCERTGLEYEGGSLGGLFAQRRNLVRPSFYRMVRDILRFNRNAPRLLDAAREETTLEEFLRDHWKELDRYTPDGRFPIDNDVERLMKQIALGRKNWLFVGNFAGGQRAAVLMTIVSSSIRSDFDGRVYLKDVFDQLLAGSTDYVSPCPHVWKLANPEAVRTERVDGRRNAADRQRVCCARRRLARGP